MQLDWRRDSCSWLEPQDIRKTGNVSYTSQHPFLAAFRQAASSSGKLRIHVPNAQTPFLLCTMPPGAWGTPALPPVPLGPRWSDLVVAHAFDSVGFWRFLHLVSRHFSDVWVFSPMKLQVLWIALQNAFATGQFTIHWIFGDGGIFFHRLKETNATSGVSVVAMKLALEALQREKDVRVFLWNSPIWLLHGYYK